MPGSQIKLVVHYDSGPEYCKVTDIERCLMDHDDVSIYGNPMGFYREPIAADTPNEWLIAVPEPILPRLHIPNNGAIFRQLPAGTVVDASFVTAHRGDPQPRGSPITLCSQKNLYPKGLIRPGAKLAQV